MSDPHDPRSGHVGPGASRQRARIRLISLVLGLVVLLGAVGVSSSAARKEPRADKVSATNRALAPAVAANRREHKRLMRKRNTARERRTRRKSRSAYKKLRGSKSIKLARAKFDMMAEPLWQPPEVPNAARVDEYLGDRAMVVDLPGDGKALVESLLPLVAHEDDGGKGPVDLGIEADGDAFEPRNALVKSRLPKKLGSAATLSGGISVSVEGADVAGRAVDGKVYYPEALPATDVAIAPLPTGIEYFAQLRSPSSPEEYVLMFDLPPGARLDETKDGRVEIVDGKVLIGTISAPVTVDADGVEVPTSYKLAGKKLTVRVAHEGRDLKWPLLSDPVIESFRWHCPTIQNPPPPHDDTGYWCGGSGADTAGWFYEESPVNDSRFIYGFNGNGGYGLDLYMADNGSYPAYANGSWNWRAPGAAYIYRAEFGLFKFSGGTNVHVAQGIAQPSGAWEDGPRGAVWFGPGLPGGTSPWVGSNVADPWRWRTHCVRPGCEWNRDDIPGPNTYRVVLFSGGTYSSYAYAHLGAAYMYLHDRDAPTWTDKGSGSSSWATNHSGSFTLGATDPSLGMKTLQVVWPPAVGGSKSETDSCPGGNAHQGDEQPWRRCDGPFSASFSYDTAGWPEGEQVIQIRAADVVGNYNPDNETKTFKIDRTRPEYNADSGELREGGPNWITDPSPSLTVDIRDPTTNASQVSGVKYSKIEFDPPNGPSDTKQNDNADGSVSPCDAASGCRSTLNQPHTLTWDNPPDGTRSIRVSSEDAAGNPKSRTWNVTFERAGPSIDSLAGPLSINHKWVKPGNTYSLTADTSDSASGVKEIRLKVNGNQVDSASGDPRPGTSACDSAGCHRDPPAKTLSWTVPSTYDDPPATVEVVAIDVAGNVSEASRTIRVDGNPPKADLAGSLWDARGKAVRGTAFELFMQGTDGDDELQSSGVQQMFLDTRPPGGALTEHGHSDFQTCAYSSCPQEHTFTFSPTSADAGRTSRRFVPRVRDQVGLENPPEPFDVLFDNLAPTLDEPTGKPEPDRWYKDHQSFNTTLTAHDAGSGVKLLQLFTPKVDGEDVQTHDDTTCSDALTSLCPPDPPARTFSYSTATMPEGASNTVRAVAQDAVTHQSTARAWPVKVDKTAPDEPAPSGELWDLRDRAIDEGEYALHVEATDGNPAGSSHAGVEFIRIYVQDPNTGGWTEQDPAGAAVSGCAANCPHSASRDWVFDTDGRVEGQRTIRVTSLDKAGNGRSKDIKVIFDKTPPEFMERSGTLWDAQGQSNLSGKYYLTVRAKDGDLSNPPLTARSGVARIEILVDGVREELVEQECPAGSCGLSLENWEFDAASYAGGDHRVEIVVTDVLDHELTSSFDVHTECCRSTSTSWGTFLGNEVHFGDADGDGAADAILRSPLGAVSVARSTRSGFAAPTQWGSWNPAYELHVGDTNGDRRADLLGRLAPATGAASVQSAVLVGVSNGSSFAAEATWGTWSSAYEMTPADLDGDRAVDLIGRNPITGDVRGAWSNRTNEFFGTKSWGNWDSGHELRFIDVDSDAAADVVDHDQGTGAVTVGLSDGYEFAAGSTWATYDPALYDLTFGDVDGNFAADLIARESDGDLMYGLSTHEAFQAGEPFGSWPAGYTLEAPDANGDGRADITGVNPLTRDVLVSLSNAPALELPESGGLDPDVPIGDDVLDVPEDPTDISAAATKPLKIGFQDDARLFQRENLYVGAAPWEGDRPAADAKINRVFSIMKAAGATVVRFNVRWGLHENAREGAGFRGDNPDPTKNRRYDFWHLHNTVKMARDAGLEVELTITGAERDCNWNINRYGRSCPVVDDQNQYGSTKDDPVASEFKDFVKATVLHFTRGVDPDSPGADPYAEPDEDDPVLPKDDRVRTFAIWNEPNLPGWLRVNGDNGLAAAATYRELYKEGFAGYTEAIDEAVQGGGTAPKVGGTQILIGELAPSQYPGRIEGAPASDNCSKHCTISSMRFTDHVANSSSDPLIADGFALHPYQISAPPWATPAPKDATGIGRLRFVGDRLGELCKPIVSGKCDGELRTPGGKRLPIMVTEFGYHNMPWTNSDSDWHSEKRRAQFIRGRIVQGKDRSPAGHAREYAKWFIWYHALELHPNEPRNDNWDTGFISIRPPGTDGETQTNANGSPIVNWETVGWRYYNKTGTASPYSFYDRNNPTAIRVRRQAYCALREWTYKRGRSHGEYKTKRCPSN